MAIEIYVNGKKEFFEAVGTLADLLTLKKIRPEIITAEVNDSVIEREKYGETEIKTGDRIEIVFFMGGGCTPHAEESILNLIGNTPLARLNRIPEKDSAEIFAKLEYFNPGGSVKDRIALGMIVDAEKREVLVQGGTVIEPTSGNTGIGLALVCAVRGYRCILTMPEGMSLERIYILKSYGAEVVLTPAKKGMEGAIEEAKKLQEKIPDSFMPNQFENASNPAMHKYSTGPEIWEQMEGKIDFFVAGIGTGGTITGAGEYLKSKNSSLSIVGVEPASSPVISQGKAGPHKIQGIGAGFIPSILKKDLIDSMITVEDDEAFRLSKRLSREEGIFAGISSGAALYGALETAKKFGPGKKGAVVFPDTGERYFSVEQYYHA
ncbi:MAG TPA: cysteine synthase A [bacterium]|nr:cysteine synthase A [bacterium]